MPRGNGTGPMGMGAKSGRAAGYCAGFSVAGYTNSGSAENIRFALGRGHRGSCHGWRNMFYATGLPGCMRAGNIPFANGLGVQMSADPEAEIQALKNQADALQAELDAIRQRLHGMDSETAAEKQS